MPLQDILNAIVAQTDQKITEERSAHQKKLSAMREASERSLSTKKQDLALQKEKKKAQLHAKAEAHADAVLRNALLSKKRELLDQLYSKALTELSSLPDEKVEPLLATFLQKISAKGSIIPSDNHLKLLKKLVKDGLQVEKPVKGAGGFLFVSNLQEQDFTFEHIVQEWLRPKTELNVSKKLFT
jgi:vacuolar-type H+-ATPase subunit E/Vma4